MSETIIVDGINTQLKLSEKMIASLKDDYDGIPDQHNEAAVGFIYALRSIGVSSDDVLKITDDNE